MKALLAACVVLAIACGAGAAQAADDGLSLRRAHQALHAASPSDGKRRLVRSAAGHAFTPLGAGNYNIQVTLVHGVYGTSAAKTKISPK